MIIQLLKNFLFIPEPPTRGFTRRQSGKYPGTSYLDTI